MFADWTDRIAAGEVPPAPPRPQGVERNVVITQWDWADPKAYLHDEVSTDRRNPTVNANGPIYGALELSADYLPVLDPVRTHDRADPADGARSEHAADVAADAAAVAVLGQRSDLDQQEQRAQPDARRKGTRVAHLRRAAARRTPTSARKDRAIRRRSCFRSPRAGRHLAVYDPKTQEADAHQHLLRHAPPDVRRGREQHAVDERRRPGGRLAEHEDVRRDRRRGEVAGLDGARSWTPTATASATPTSSRTSRSIPRRTSGSAAASTAVAPAPDGSVWGSVLGFPGAVVRLNPGSNPPETALAEVYEPPFDNPEGARSWLLAARHGRRSQRRRLGGARERPPGQLRSPQVQGPAQRTDGDRAALPRGLDALSGAAAADQGRDRLGQRRGELLHVGRSVRHVRASAPTRRSTPATRPKGCWR